MSQNRESIFQKKKGHRRSLTNLIKASPLPFRNFYQYTNSATFSQIQMKDHRFTFKSKMIKLTRKNRQRKISSAKTGVSNDALYEIKANKNCNEEKKNKCPLKCELIRKTPIHNYQNRAKMIRGYYQIQTSLQVSNIPLANRKLPERKKSKAFLKKSKQKQNAKPDNIDEEDYLFSMEKKRIQKFHSLKSDK